MLVNRLWLIRGRSHFLKQGTDRMFLKSDVTGHKLVVPPRFYGAKSVSYTYNFGTKAYLRILVLRVQAVSRVTEMAKENYIVKFLMKIVLYSCNMKHLTSGQIYVSKPVTALLSRLSGGGGVELRE